ncbi:MAG: cation diffusion facilitator family transporter [Opitutales bacterium]
MSHEHNHSHGTEDVSDGVLLWSVIINTALSLFEFIAGAISGSVALMADALHNTNDAAALLIAYVARKISRKGADAHYTFGYRRAELIGAMIQLTALILVGLYLIYEAVGRFISPEPLQGGWIMAAAGIALLVDVVTAWLLWAMSKGSLNVKAAFLHNLTDAAASLAVLVGGATIFWLDWTWVDPVLTLIIADYILYMSFGMLRKTSRILMEGTPPEVSIDAIMKRLEAIEGVDDVHHVHVWELDEQHRAIEAHIMLGEPENHQAENVAAVKAAVRDSLREEFAIHHATLETEYGGDSCASCGLR